MTHLKTILLAILAPVALATRLILNLLPVLTARRSDNRRGFNFLPMMAVVCFAAFLTACGGGGGNSASAPTPSAPTTLNITSPELAAIHELDDDGSYRFHVGRVAAQGLTLSSGTGLQFVIQRMRVGRINLNSHIPLQRLTLAASVTSFWHAEVGGEFSEIRDEFGQAIILQAGEGQVFFETRADITAIVQLCPAPWLATYINANFPGTTCPAMTGLSYSPDMRQVVVAAMADGFDRGFAIGESGFAFSGRYDGDNRAAGFSYDLGGYALRTDYIRLPSRQDSEVRLDTYRFGALTRLNDETRFFAGMDNYQNAIFVMDTNGDNGNNLHRLGFAIGEGYAVKYEYRLNL